MTYKCAVTCPTCAGHKTVQHYGPRQCPTCQGCGKVVPERMLDLKTDDWLDACRDVNVQRDRAEKAEAQVQNRDAVLVAFDEQEREVTEWQRMSAENAAGFHRLQARIEELEAEVNALRQERDYWRNVDPSSRKRVARAEVRVEQLEVLLWELLMAPPQGFLHDAMVERAHATLFPQKGNDE